MYFNAEVDNAFHIWRQRFPDGQPEQITFGPTEEEGIAMAPDGRSLVTSIGARQSAVWIHDLRGDRALTTEGFAFAPMLSRDRRRVFYLHRSTPGLAGELYTHDLESGTSERVLPGIAISDFDLSPDGTEVAYTTKPRVDESIVWVAPLDRRSAPRPIATGADEASFVAGGDVVFRSLGETSNALGRVRRDGSGRRQVGDYVILNKMRVSPDGEWVMTFVAEGEETYTLAIPLNGGAPVRICGVFCQASWSADGRALFVGVQGGGSGDPSMIGPGRTLALPIPAGRATPDLPPGGVPLDVSWSGPPGTRVIDRGLIGPGSDPSTYAFVVMELQRNLYRIPLK